MNCCRRTLVTIFAVLVSLPVTASDRITDSQITRALEAAFKRDLRLQRVDVQVTTLSGSVTLRGSVTSFSDKHLAERMAKRTAGVRRVVNMIQVESPFRRDDDVAEDVRRRLSQSSFLRAISVDVEVARGVVTLTGTVPAWAHLRQAELIVGEVHGVKLVRNNLRLGGLVSSESSAAADEQIRAEVRSALDRDTHLFDLQIEVSVKSGVVGLAGEVPNLFHKEHAAEEARLVAHVKQVENHLVVVSQLMLKMSPVPPTDEELARVVLDELAADPRVDAERIDVVADRSHVTLTGFVESLFERQAAARVARGVTGVSRVENQLVVDSAARGDEAIRGDAQFNLASDALLTGQPLVVTVKDAVATLSGESDSFSGKTHAARLVARVRGVRSITNEIRVRWSETTDDDVLRQGVAERLNSNAITRPVASRIDVVVEKGVVKLTGSVDRASQMMEAGRIAQSTDRVRSVECLLTVQSPSDK